MPGNADPNGSARRQVIGEVATRVLEPNRLENMLRAYVRTSLEREDKNRVCMRELRQAHKEADAGITRLLELVEKGLIDAEDSTLRERLVGQRFRRDELVGDIADLHRRLSSAEPVITSEKIGRVALLLRDKL